MSASLKDDFRSFRRTWVHHTGMQLATLTVLASTFFVVAFVLSLSLNLKRILASWGDGAQITVYVMESADEQQIAEVHKELERFADVETITFIPRETATADFKKQMASYAPDLLSDTDFANPFPASFRLALKSDIASDKQVEHLEALAGVIGKLDGVEDVSWGQSWVRNYSAFVSVLNASGGVMALILLAGSLFVIGNSIRVSITARREEISILELVGATSSMIRRPFIAEGLMMGVLAAAIAITLNLFIHLWQKSMMAESLVLARIVPLVTFFDFISVIGLITLGGALGAIGAWLTIRRINDGWAASHGGET